MDGAKEKPKIQVLRAPLAAGESAEHAAHWARLAKALKTFTDFEETEIQAISKDELTQLTANFAYTFLDTSIAPWAELTKSPVPNLCLVQSLDASWTSESKALRLPVIAKHSCLLLEAFGASDLLRVLHLYLLPKRMAGVTPLMEKGSIIVGEKALDTNKIGTLLDRFHAYGEQLEAFTLKSRLPDLRQVLSALVVEGLRCAKAANTVYPFVDFQVSAAAQKLAVNLRFPRGDLNPSFLTTEILQGTNLFWFQIWQCSDLLLITHHEEQDEIEVMILINRPERNSNLGFRSILFKTAKETSKREDLLDPPRNFTFKILSEINIKETATVTHISGAQEELDLEEDISNIPPSIASKLHQLQEQTQTLNDHLARKEIQLQDISRKFHNATQELFVKRGELAKAEQQSETQQETSTRKIRDLEEQLEQLKTFVSTNSQSKNAQSTASMQELVSKMEGNVRAMENEKNHLRDGILHEQKKVLGLEQKYSALYKEMAQKDREIYELKNNINKARKDQSQKQVAQTAHEEGRDKINAQLREAEEKEAHYKQEVKKLTFKLESQEKNIRGLQHDSSEKLKLLDQKLKAAKTKEVDLLKRIDELTSNLKKASKVA